MLETKIPQDIRDYEEKIIFGMSGRKLLCIGIALGISIVSGFLLVKCAGLPFSIASYPIILLVLPVLAIGFLRKDGQPFEKYFWLVIRQTSGNQKRLVYKITNGGNNERRIVPTEKAARRVESGCGEYTEYSPADRAKRRKRTKDHISRAREEVKAGRKE